MNKINENKEIAEIYISMDIEADGPIPGPYSMLSLGAVVAGYRTKDKEYVKLDVMKPENRFYVEIKPISENYVVNAMKVGIFTGFSKKDVNADPTGEKQREYIMTHGEDPIDAMNSLNAWVESQKLRFNTRGAIFAAFPLGFDWMFTYWYIVNFAETVSPFGHSRHIDIKTLFAEKANAPIINGVKARMPKHIMSKLPHTHLAVQDAAEQGELLMNILTWEGK